MSRIGKQPIALPDGVSAKLDGQTLTVVGPRGELTYAVHPAVKVVVTDSEITCEPDGTSKNVRAMWGTNRARIANLVAGVHEGFRKELEIQGVGYRVQLKGSDLELILGYSHPILVAAPEGISFSVDKEIVTVEGNDNVLVGQVAADIRAARKPEPYKGKGVRYRGEQVRRKVGKVAGAVE